MSARRKSLVSRKLAKSIIPGTNLAFLSHRRTANLSPRVEENGGLQLDLFKSQEHRLMMDLVYVAAIVGFFAVCVAYTYAFDRI